MTIFLIYLTIASKRVYGNTSPVRTDYRYSRRGYRWFLWMWKGMIVLEFVDTVTQRSRWLWNGLQCPFSERTLSLNDAPALARHCRSHFLPVFQCSRDDAYLPLRPRPSVIDRLRPKLSSVDGWHPATPGRGQSRQNSTDTSSGSDSWQNGRPPSTPTPVSTPTPQPCF